MKIIHLSDLHFGTEIKHSVPLLIHAIEELQADLVIVSGDLTQRAKTHQFIAANQFLRAINTPVLCVPGNHDIALYRIIERLFYPFTKYQKWINSSLCAQYTNDLVAILGINSVTPYKPMGGYVTEAQLALIKDFFQAQPDNKIKIIVMHHNLVRAERHKNINDAEKLIKFFAACKVSLVLSGHIHLAHIEKLRQNYLQHPMYVVTAGTAISTRTIQPNSFNVIELEAQQFKLIVRVLENDKYVVAAENIFPLL